MTTLRRQLLIGLLAGMLVSTLISGAVTYERVRRAAAELFDYQLAQVAANLPLRIDSQPEPPDDGDPDNDILIQIWNGEGRLIYPIRPAVTLQKPQAFGYSEDPEGRGWRTYSESQRGRTVLIAQPLRSREKLAASLVVRALVPFLTLIPVLGLLTWLIVGRTLRPLRQVAEEVAGRSANALQPITEVNLPQEIRPLIDAMNNLLSRLDRAFTAQRAFVADAAHELRSPLTALRLQLQLADRALPGESRAIAFAKAYERLDRATHLVHQLLVLARQEPGFAEEQAQESIALDDLARLITKDFETLAQDRGVSFALHVGGSGSKVVGNVEALRIMLGNVVDNALRYTPCGGKVSVETGVENASPFVRIVDDGPGVPLEEREKVFHRFHRGEAVKVSGSGLGLAIVRSVAERHGCLILMCDPVNGTGLVFTIYFASPTLNDAMPT